MQVVYATQEFPEEWSHALFLAGPTPRSDNPVPSWRPEALAILEANGYDGVVFVPETEDGAWKHSYTDQTDWERQGLQFADKIVFWVPRDLETMPAFTTNVEFGSWVRGDAHRIVLGHPEDAPKTRYLDWMLGDETNGAAKVYHTLEDTILAAADTRPPPNQRDATLRKGGERYVPMHVWRSPMFQSWYASQRAAGNRLDEAELLWSFRPPQAQHFLFAYALWVKVWIESEQRHKSNEFIISRPDISTVLLYTEPTGGVNAAVDLLNVEVVLIREFRSPARTHDGFIREIAGGSSFKPNKDPLEVASSEVYEETGLVVPADRFRRVDARQLAGTLSTHFAHLYAAELTEAEMTQAKTLAANNVAHGVAEDTERTYVEVSRLGDLLATGTVDWSMLGMIFAGLMTRE